MPKDGPPSTWPPVPNQPEPPQPCIRGAAKTAETAAPGHVQCKKCHWWHEFVDGVGEAIGDAFDNRG